MIQLYLVNAVPALRGGVEIPNSQAPEHFAVVIPGVKATFMSFGNEGHFLVSADTDEATHATLAALPRVTQLPANLNAKPQDEDQVTAIKNFLEARNIPAHWVTTALTYRKMLRVMVGIFQFAQVYFRLHGLTLFRNGVNLDTEARQIPLAERNRLSEAAQVAGLDTSGITGTTTVREILRQLGQQWLNRPVQLGGAI